jgi:hypothetical protein
MEEEKVLAHRIQNGWAFPPPEERRVPSLNVKGWREGV